MKAIPIKEPIEKYSLKSLFLEITRKCNLKCEHCLCGEAQNLTISKKVIDRMFEQIENATNITLTGGEPLLAVDMIEYFFRKLKQSQWKPLYIDIVTNGTIKNEKIIDVFADYALYNKNLYFVFPYDIYNYYEEDILDSCLFQELAELDLEYQNNSK